MFQAAALAATKGPPHVFKTQGGRGITDEEEEDDDDDDEDRAPTSAVAVRVSTGATMRRIAAMSTLLFI
mgnify:CR=1 FL=1